MVFISYLYIILLVRGMEKVSTLTPMSYVKKIKFDILQILFSSERAAVEGIYIFRMFNGLCGTIYFYVHLRSRCTSDMWRILRVGAPSVS